MNIIVYLINQPLRIKALVEFLGLITPFVALAESLAVILVLRFLDVVEREPNFFAGARDGENEPAPGCCCFGKLYGNGTLSKT